MTSDRPYEKPLPQLDARSRPWWDGAKRHELLIQSCGECGHLTLPPAPNCPRCRGTALSWTVASGRGTIWSWTIFHKSYFAGFAADVPYAVAIVELEEGPRLWTQIVGVRPADIQIGAPVEATFDDVTDEITLVKFKPSQQ